jgi:DNA-binding NtrC family response regulator
LDQNADNSLTDARTNSQVAEKPPLKVLVVDDEWLVRWTVTEALRERGLQVDQAADLRSAMRALDERYDLVLLDLHLPDSQDLRLLSLIRARSAALPVIVMTAFATREIVEEAASLGATVVHKPFELDGLANAVERALTCRVY